VNSRAKDLPHHLRCVLFDLVPMLALKKNDLRCSHQLGHRDVRLSLRVGWALDDVDDGFGQVKLVRYFHCVLSSSHLRTNMQHSQDKLHSLL